MSSLRWTVALAAVVGATCFTSRASAQETPRNDRVDVPPDTSGTTSRTGTYDEGTYDTRPMTTTPTEPKPSSTSSTTTSTTRTTGAVYDENAGAERETTIHPNRPMLVTGVVMFAAPYIAGDIVAAQSNLDADKRNFIPVAGPWLDLGQRPCTFGSACTTTDNVGSALLIGSGVAQAAGVVLALASFAVPEHTTEKVQPASASVHVLPVSFAGGGGVGALGTF